MEKILDQSIRRHRSSPANPIKGILRFLTAYLSLALLFVAGMLNLAFYSSAQAIVQLKAPNHLRWRLIGLFSMSALGLRALSGVTVGIMGGFVGIHWSLAASALALLVVTAALLVYVGSHYYPKG